MTSHTLAISRTLHLPPTDPVLLRIYRLLTLLDNLVVWFKINYHLDNNVLKKKKSANFEKSAGRERFYGNLYNSSAPESNDGSIAKMFDRVLEKEFSENDQPEGFRWYGFYFGGELVHSNPVLEAFGNAKTVRNNNSSRFGKFVELQFDNRGRISGAAIRTYLLERSRVCQVSDPERNYHCFYMLCAAPAEDVERYKLGNPRTFHYLNQSNCYELDGVDDSKEYLVTRKAMDIVGIGSDEQDSIFRVVAAILHLGNIEFTKGTESDSSEPKDEKSRFHLKTAAELFICDEKSLEDSLCKRVIVTCDETITKCLDPDAATVSRDALAKIVYSRLFDWLVNKINNSIGQDPDSKYLIGVLDIYGFESFKTNSFEQFCINLTNEKLQQHFNQHVFKMEQEEYTKEEIDWSYIEFIDNQDVLDLLEKKPGGIIALLDEACMFPRSTHETFAQKVYQTFKDNKRFSKPKLARTDFTICHYAGDVTYQTELFLDKNKDYVVAEHQELLSASKCSFVSGLFPPLPEESSKSSKFSSIGSRFKLHAVRETYVSCLLLCEVMDAEICGNCNNEIFSVAKVIFSFCLISNLYSSCFFLQFFLSIRPQLIHLEMACLIMLIQGQISLFVTCSQRNFDMTKSSNALITHKKAYSIIYCKTKKVLLKGGTYHKPSSPNTLKRLTRERKIVFPLLSFFFELLEFLSSKERTRLFVRLREDEEEVFGGVGWREFMSILVFDGVSCEYYLENSLKRVWEILVLKSHLKLKFLSSTN
ncbi:hypothetical protein UlMin_037554 [Ulmus minor]